MNTLTIHLPDSVDPSQARWELARSLYEKGSLTVEQAASLAELTTTYFKMRLAGMLTGVKLSTSNVPAQPFAPEQVRKIAEQMDIQESWEELVAQIGK